MSWFVSRVSVFALQMPFVKVSLIVSFRATVFGMSPDVAPALIVTVKNRIFVRFLGNVTTKMASVLLQVMPIVCVHIIVDFLVIVPKVWGVARQLPIKTVDYHRFVRCTANAT